MRITRCAQHIRVVATSAPNAPVKTSRGGPTELKFGSHPLRQTYLELGYISRAQLNNALDYQRRKGGRLGWIMGALGYMNRLQVKDGLERFYYEQTKRHPMILPFLVNV